MPKIFDALAGLGRGVEGAQDYYARKQALEHGQLAIQKARADMAEEQAGRQREEGYRQAMSEAVQSLGKIADSGLMPEGGPDPLQMYGPQEGAQVGAGRNLAEIQAWLKGKDDPTAQALDQLRSVASRVARDDPNAAMMLLQQGGEQIKGRVVQQAQQRFMQSGSKKIQSISQLGASGRLPEEAAGMFADQIEQAMAVVEQDPRQMAGAQEILAKIDAQIQETLKEQDAQQLALQELDWFKTRPSGYDAAAVMEAQRRIEMGEDPTKAVEWLHATEKHGWQGGLLEDAPDRLRAQWNADAKQAARQFAAETLKKEPLEKPDAYLARVLQTANQLEPQFLEETYQRNGVTGHKLVNPPVMQGWTSGLPRGQQGKPSLQDVIAGKALQGQGSGRGGDYTQAATASVFPSMQSAPEKAVQSGQKPDAGPESASLTKLKAKPPKRRKGEDVGDFVARVAQMVKARGGSEDDLPALLEAAGITPEDLDQGPR
jgi:hypothetical protein